MLDFSFRNKSLAKANQPKIQTLLELSFSSSEEEILHKYCLESEYSAAQNFLFMYYLNRSRFKEAISIHYQILFDSKRQEIIKNLVKAIPSLENEISTMAISFREYTTKNIESELEIKPSDGSSSPLAESNKLITEDLLMKDDKNESDFQISSFKSTSDVESVEEESVCDSSSLPQESVENGVHEEADLESSNQNQESFMVSSDDRFDLMDILINRSIINVEYSEDESRSISPIPQNHISMDADSILFTPEASAVINSEANLTPLASVLKEDSNNSVIDTPKAKIVFTPSLRNISPFHHVAEPPKTGMK